MIIFSIILMILGGLSTLMVLIFQKFGFFVSGNIRWFYFGILIYLLGYGVYLCGEGKHSK